MYALSSVFLLKSSDSVKVQVNDKNYDISGFPGVCFIKRWRSILLHKNDIMTISRCYVSLKCVRL